MAEKLSCATLYRMMQHWKSKMLMQHAHEYSTRLNLKLQVMAPVTAGARAYLDPVDALDAWTGSHGKIQIPQIFRSREDMTYWATPH